MDVAALLNANPILSIVITYLFFVNLTAYLMFWTDKVYAQKGHWRISDKRPNMGSCSPYQKL